MPVVRPLSDGLPRITCTWRLLQVTIATDGDVLACVGPELEGSQSFSSPWTSECSLPLSPFTVQPSLLSRAQGSPAASCLHEPAMDLAHLRSVADFLSSELIQGRLLSFLSPQQAVAKMSVRAVHWWVSSEG